MASWCERCDHIIAMPTDDCGGSEDFPWELCPLSAGKQLSATCLARIQEQYHTDCDPPDIFPPAQNTGTAVTIAPGTTVTSTPSDSVYLFIVVILMVFIFNLFCCLFAYFYCCTNLFRKRNTGMAGLDTLEPVRFDELIGRGPPTQTNPRLDYYFANVPPGLSEPAPHPDNSRFRQPYYAHLENSQPSTYNSPRHRNHHPHGPGRSEPPPRRRRRRSPPREEFPPYRRDLSRAHSAGPQRPNHPPSYDVLFDGRKLEHNRRRETQQRNRSKSQPKHEHRSRSGGASQSRNSPMSPNMPLRERIQQSRSRTCLPEPNSRLGPLSPLVEDDQDFSYDTGTSFPVVEPGSPLEHLTNTYPNKELR